MPTTRKIQAGNENTVPLNISADQDDDALTRAAENDPDSPPLSDEELRRMKPAAVMLPLIFGADVAAQMLKPRQRGASAPAAIESASVSGPRRDGKGRAG